MKFYYTFGMGFWIEAADEKAAREWANGVQIAAEEELAKSGELDLSEIEHQPDMDKEA